MTDKEQHQQEQQRGCEHNFVESKIKQRFQVIKKIGSGAYGHVWKVRCKQTKTIFAIKKVFLAFQDQTDAQRVYRQINLLKKINHDNVVKLKQIISSDNHTDIYLLFEYLESDVFQAIKNRVLDQTHKKFIVYQLACGLKYLHSGGVIHRDLKPSNILINSSCDIKICDFGLSRSVTSQFFNKPIMTEFIATRWYRAPQVLMGSKGYSFKSDMWSLGCLIYQLYSRRTLLPGENTIDQINKLLQFKGIPTAEEIQSFKAIKSSEILTFFKVQRQPEEYYFNDLQNNEIKLVLRNLLQYNPNKRWSAQQLLQCDFLKQFKNTLPENACKTPIQLELNDNRRYGIERYKDQIIMLTGQKQSKQKLLSKRIYLSHRASNTKSNYSLHTSLSKFAKPSLNSTTIRGSFKQKKQFKSAHVSPNANKSIDEIVTKAKSNLLRVSQRLKVSERKARQSKDINMVENSKKMRSKHSKRQQKDVKFKEHGEPNKENYEKRLKVLKKQRLRHYRSDYNFENSVFK